MNLFENFINLKTFEFQFLIGGEISFEFFFQINFLNKYMAMIFDA